MDCIGILHSKPPANFSVVRPQALHNARVKFFFWRLGPWGLRDCPIAAARAFAPAQEQRHGCQSADFIEPRAAFRAGHSLLSLFARLPEAELNVMCLAPPCFHGVQNFREIGDRV